MLVHTLWALFMHQMEIQPNLFLCYHLFSSGGFFFRHLSEKWIHEVKEEKFTQKKTALVQKVIRTHFPQAVYGTCSSCCKRFRNRSRMHPIFSSYFLGAAVKPFMMLRREKRKEISGFVSFLAFLTTHIYPWFQKSWLITCAFIFAAHCKKNDFRRGRVPSYWL